MNKTSQTPLFFILISAIGIALLIYAGVQFIKTVKFVSVAVRTKGKVISRMGSRAPAVAFKGPNGKEVTFTSKISGYNPYLPGQIVPVAFDPLYPQNAEIGTIFRIWGPVIILTFLGLLFSGPGIGIILLIRRYERMQSNFKRKLQLGAKTWEVEPSWQKGKVSSMSRRDVWNGWIGAVIWNITVIAPISFILPHEIKEGSPAIASLLLLFIPVGVWVIVASIIKTLQWQKFGSVTLVMDPFPGSIGGEVGGSIELPDVRRRRFEITLSCIEVTRTNTKKRSERIIWQEQVFAVSEHGQIGTRLKFKFSVPAHLPETNAYHTWKLNVISDLLGIDFDREFIIPVYNTGEPQLSRLIINSSPSFPIPGRIAKGKQTPNRLFIYYPTDRNFMEGTIILLSGCILGGILTYGFIQQMLLTYSSPSSSSFFYAWIPFFSVLLGMLLVNQVYALYVVGTTLRIEVRGDQLKTLWRIFGVDVLSRKIPLSSIVSVKSKIMFSGRLSTKKTLYNIKVHTIDGKSITVGDRIEGQRIAEQLRQAISRACKLEDPSVQDSKLV